MCCNLKRSSFRKLKTETPAPLNKVNGVCLVVNSLARSSLLKMSSMPFKVGKHKHSMTLER